MTSRGSTGMMIPSASMSSSTVIKTKMKAAERAGAIDVASVMGLLHRTCHHAYVPYERSWRVMTFRFVMAGLVRLVTAIHVFLARARKARRGCPRQAGQARA